MMKRLLRITLVLLALVIVAGVGWFRLIAPPAPPPAETGPQVVAVVNGAAITGQMIDREVNTSRFNVLAPPPPLTGDDLALARDEALNQLVSRQLILQAARRQGFSLSDAEVADRVDLLFGTATPAELDAALAQAGLTRDDLRWWIGQIFTVEAFTTDVLLADVPPDDRQAVYNSWYNALRAEAEIQFPGRSDADAAVQALPGQPAPDFTLAGLDGRPVSLADYRGRVVLVNFWATWCPTCVTEMPDYEQVYRQFSPDFVVLGVNLQESPAQVEKYAAGLGLSFPVLLDADGQVTNRQYRVTGMPGSFIINRDGVIIYRHAGPMPAKTLRTKLADLGL
ncbi:MAG: hypothetical protein D6768_14895 [Chloroflexi bacterium]|nr:MAG: hypothetical protein D6768_14895 [Chloroflexota bacterium]